MTPEPPKQRIPIPRDEAAEALYLADRTCCVCTTPGRPVQLHHIDGDPANNRPENLAVLCLECHNLTLLAGGFGRQLDAAQVIRYRDEWLATVRGRREKADRLAVTAGAMPARAAPEMEASHEPPALPPRSGLAAFLNTLPRLRRLAREAGEPGETTADMMQSGYLTLQVLETALLGLARFYPHKHFGVDDPRDYFGELISSRFRWHRLHHSTYGEGFSGTIVGPLAVADVIADVEQMIEDMAGSLSLDVEAQQFDFQTWRAEWHPDPVPPEIFDHPGKAYEVEPNDLDGPARE